MGASRPFAVFDIDGTLIRWQLYHALVDRLAKNGKLGKKAYQQIKTARKKWKDRESPGAFNEYEQVLVKMCEQALKDLKTIDFDRIVHEVIEEYRNQTYIFTRNLINELKEQGYTLLIVSGSNQELIEHIGKYYGFDDWIGSRYEREGHAFTGERYIAGFDKKEALEKLIRKHSLNHEGSVAIGDTGSDIPMLEMVENPIAFNPDKRLFDAAKLNGWKIVLERKNMIYELVASDGSYRLESPR
jgi:HAD superfamily hydrolase (TIGR01490 family)